MLTWTGESEIRTDTLPYNSQIFNEKVLITVFNLVEDTLGLIE